MFEFYCGFIYVEGGTSAPECKLLRLMNSAAPEYRVDRSESTAENFDSQWRNIISYCLKEERLHKWLSSLIEN